MNKKTLQTLSILINSPKQFFRFEELAKALSVGSRSVRNYIQGIQDYLKTQDVDSVLLSVSDGGAVFTGSAEEGQQIYASVSGGDFYLYRLSPGERVSMTFLCLLLADDYYKLSDFSERFHSSRATALKDMEQVKAILSRYGLCFGPNINKGYLLVVPEIQRRHLIERTISTASGSLSGLRHPSNFFYRFLTGECGVSEHLLADLILGTENEFGLNVSDACFEEVLLYLIILTARLEHGHIVTASAYEQEPPASGCMDIAASMLRRLEQAVPALSLPRKPDSELLLLSSKLEACGFCRTGTQCRGSDLQLHMGLSYFLVMVSKELSIPFYNDQSMADLLESHLRSMITLHASGAVIQNEYAEMIIRQYPDYYHAARKHKSILEGCSGYEYRDEDIVFVVMYLLVSTEKFFTDDILPKVIVCCHTGMGTANFLAEQLKNNYRINLTAVTSSHKLTEFLKTHECDLIISTAPLAGISREWIQVSPLLTDKNIVELTNRFAAIKKERGNYRIRQSAAAASLSGSGRASGSSMPCVLLDYSCSGPDDAIRLAAMPLVDNGAVLPGYIDAILSFYHENGAYFVYCPHVALAHAGPSDGVNFFGFSILRLSGGVAFGREDFDPVRYVICMAVPDKQSYTNEILDIMTLFSIPENLNAMDQLKTPAELRQFIKNHQTGGAL